MQMREETSYGSMTWLGSFNEKMTLVLAGFKYFGGFGVPPGKRRLTLRCFIRTTDLNYVFNAHKIIIDIYIYIYIYIFL